jgi:hypothetical protein
MRSYQYAPDRWVTEAVVSTSKKTRKAARRGNSFIAACEGLERCRPPASDTACAK